MYAYIYSTTWHTIPIEKSIPFSLHSRSVNSFLSVQCRVSSDQTFSVLTVCKITYNNYAKGIGFGIATFFLVFILVFAVLDVPFVNFFLLPGKLFILAIFLLGVAVVSDHYAFII